PSLIFDLKIRFDENFTVNTDAVNSQDVLDPKSPQPNPVYFEGKPVEGPPYSQPLVTQGQITKVGAGTVSPSTNLSQLFFRIPKNAMVELNGYRQAGKFSAEFAYTDFPFEPQLLRGVGVSIYMASVPAQYFAQGMLGGNTPTPIPNAANQSYLTSVLSPTPDNVVIDGIVDECTVEHTENGDTVHIEGRDLKGILIDAWINPQLFDNLNLNQSIHKVVRDILNSDPWGAGIQVEIIPNEWFPGKGGTDAVISGKYSAFDFISLPKPASPDLLPRERMSADGKKSRSTPQGSAERLRMWDLITKYCYLVGAIPRFVDNRLRISPVRSIYDLARTVVSDPTNFQTPFANGQPRTLPSAGTAAPEKIYFRRMVFGRDLQRLSFSRKYAGASRPSIQCVSVDTSSENRGTAKLVIATWPDDAQNQQPVAQNSAQSKNPKVQQHAVAKAKTTKVSPSGTARQDVLIIPIAGFKDKNALLKIAEAIYEEIGHGEMGGNASTNNLCSFGGNADDTDLLRLLPGDPIQIVTDGAELVSRYPIVSEVNALAQKSFTAQVDAVAARVGDRNLASVYVALARNAVNELRGFYRVKDVKYTWGKGLKIDFDFENYVEIQSNMSQSTGKDIIPSARNAAPRQGTQSPTTGQQIGINSRGG
ncbi:MAG TPA: hypothetical protein VLV86_13405, partial [Vicinamibacterales bacterium]|nr:hypothetical protein [Vicinamibacterales bacterium]